MNFNDAIMHASARYIGVQEFPGKESNPVVEEFFRASGHPGLTDDVPWCAAFVGAILAECGLQGTGNLMARSYSRWGMNVPLRDAKPGDVVVIERGPPPAGHVGFFVRWSDDNVILRGGNQRDTVNEAAFPAARIVVIRCADPVRKIGMATLSQITNSKHPSVVQLQERLIALRYFTGRVDGVFGSRTAESVMAFQNDHGLDTDGVVGPRTWSALDEANPRPERKVSAKDLRESGSQTIKTADTGTLLSYGTGAVAAMTAVVNTVEEASGATASAIEILRDNWMPVAVLGVALVAAYLFSTIRAARVEAARTGANIGR